ncbi:GGDEF domain-containing protein [Paenibacillus kandeliae]|uniref:GGDEF domain-containing protein n=1 Tax=Paenibacillus kandeliae TaxID=3231269 RepID=UPI0034590B60
MILVLINNLTMVTAFLFFTNLLLNRFKEQFPRYHAAYPYLAGLLHGGLGIGLMLLSSGAPGGFHLDMRALAIVSAVYMAGRFAGGIALVCILLGRFLLLDITNMAGLLAGMTMIITTYVLAALLLTYSHRKSFHRWLGIITGGMLMPCVVVYFAMPNPYLPSTLLVMLSYLAGGVFTYLLLTYLSRTNRSLHLLKEKASRDHLTGLYNSRAFDSIFEQKLQRTQQNREPFSLLMIDIDYFKSINDTYGHAAGDTVLSSFGELLLDFVRSSDQCARKGGEEFVVLLNHCRFEQAQQTAEHLRRLVEQHSFPLLNGKQLHITISIGIATFPAIEAEQLLEQADQALYRAKHEGRNRVCSI